AAQLSGQTGGQTLFTGASAKAKWGLSPVISGHRLGESRVLAQGIEADLRSALLAHLELGPGRREERRHAGRVVGDQARMQVDEALELRRIVGGDPARAVEVGWQEAHLGAVLVRQAMHRHLELQLPDRAEDR